MTTTIKMCDMSVEKGGTIADGIVNKTVATLAAKKIVQDVKGVKDDVILDLTGCAWSSETSCRPICASIATP